MRGERAIQRVSLFDVGTQRVGIAAEVAGVTVPGGPQGVAPSWSRTSAMAVLAAKEALRHAQVHVDAARVGLVIGGTTSGMFETERVLARLHGEPECRDALASMLSHPLTSTGDRLEERLGPFVRVRSIASACSSGASAIVAAASWLLLGEVDVALAGGSDGLCRLTLTGFNALCCPGPRAVPSLRQAAARDQPGRGCGVPRHRARRARAGARGAADRGAGRLGARRRSAPHHESGGRRRAGRVAVGRRHRTRGAGAARYRLRQCARNRNPAERRDGSRRPRAGTRARGAIASLCRAARARLATRSAPPELSRRP